MTAPVLGRGRRRARRLAGRGVYLARRLAGLPGAAWWHLVVAQVALLWAQLLVWVRPVGGLVDPATPPGAAAAPAAAPLSAEQRQRAEALALAVRRAAAYGLFRPLCLVRSVALNRLLERAGVRGSQIRVGVRFRGGQFAAHAWVEHNGLVLGDSLAHVRQFEQLSDVRLAKWS